MGRRHNKLIQRLADEIRDSSIAVNLGRDLAYNHERLKLAIARAELPLLERNDVDGRFTLADGMHALARSGRQIGAGVAVTAGHYHRAFRLYQSVSDPRAAFTALMGQALAVQASRPSEALRLLHNARALRESSWDRTEAVRWWVRQVGAMRAAGATHEAALIFRSRVVLLARDATPPPLERYIWVNSQIATLVDGNVDYDSAWASLGDSCDFQSESMDLIALHDRHIEIARLCIASGEHHLAESEILTAREIAVRNGYDTTRIATVMRQIDQGS